MTGPVLHTTNSTTTAADSQAFADHLPQLAWMADRDGDRYWHNQRWSAYTGQGLDASRGWRWLQFVDRDHVERVETSLRNAVTTGGSWEETFPLRSSDGTYRWFLS